MLDQVLEWVLGSPLARRGHTPLYSLQTFYSTIVLHLPVTWATPEEGRDSIGREWGKSEGTEERRNRNRREGIGTEEKEKRRTREGLECEGWDREEKQGRGDGGEEIMRAKTREGEKGGKKAGEKERRDSRIRAEQKGGGEGRREDRRKEE